MSRSRLNVFLERDHAKRLDQLAATKGVSKSGIVGAALASFLSPEGADRREAAIARRLDRLTRQFERLERDQTILIETLALFIRHHLSVTPPIPEAHVEAARAQGRARFEQFIEQLALHLQRGTRIRDAIDELVPSEGAFATVGEEGTACATLA
jgi:predicted transcriptional regulator